METHSQTDTTHGPGKHVKLSSHYYVLSLSEHMNRLYEAFRDTLIDIQNTWFPLETVMSPLQPALNDAQLRTLLQKVDFHFAQYYGHEPLGVVLAGTERHQSTFASLTALPNVIIGKAAGGDHSSTSVSDLGSIVWPIVKEAMAKAGEYEAPGLEVAARGNNVVVGLDSVAHTDSGVGATLLVENAYRVKPAESSSRIDDFDNVVDAAIEKVLASGGNVVFVEDGSLSKFQRMAMILRA